MRRSRGARSGSNPARTVARVSKNASTQQTQRDEPTADGRHKVIKTDEQWRAELDPAEYQVLRRAGTERAFTGEYTDTTRAGIYYCRACGAELFRSEQKFASHCGWPSFYAPSEQDNVVLHRDRSSFMERVEVRCGTCDSHLGHVFSGEGYATPTDERFCINSVALRMEPLPAS